MLFLISTGLLSGLFFSSTFILNRVMSLEGGHWLWSASLRYLFVIILLFILLSIFQGIKKTKQVLILFIENWFFWVVAGSIGFGGFYSLICFSADHAPAWVIATTWQVTIIASLIVLSAFGRKPPKKIWLFSLIIFSGVFIVNLSHVETGSWGILLVSGFPVIIAAFCYPLGNQLVWEAKKGNSKLPSIKNSLLENPFNKTLLLSIGSIPYWLLLILYIHPPHPTQGQIINTALVAVLSGIIATSLFLFARNRSSSPSELAAVDSTQSSEVVFAMLGEYLFLNTAVPEFMAMSGIFLVFIGLFLFIKFQKIQS